MVAAQRRAPARYQYVTEEKADGATFTPSRLAGFVAQQIVVNLPVASGKAIRVLDPAVGEGALLVKLLEEMDSRGLNNIEVHGFDTNPQSLSFAEHAIRTKFPLVPIQFRSGDFLEFAAQFAGTTSLFGNAVPERFDVIIANPPYVRTQIMGAAHAQSLASYFGLGGRVDLYHAFILGMIEVLEDNGVAGIIVSNRFMTTKSGSSVRKVIRESVYINHVWDLGDTKLFDAAVLPAVLLLTKDDPRTDGNPPFTSIYEISGAATGFAQDAIAALGESGTVLIGDGRCFQVTHGALDLNTASDGIWRVATDMTDAWLRAVKTHTWRSFGDVGSIRVGIKTCADKVFIKPDWDAVPQPDRPELLRPLTTHHMGRRFKADTTKAGRQVLYPHFAMNSKCEAADLSLYPKSAAYLEKHRLLLESRSYVLEARRRWYEIWVPQDPGAWGLPKLVFRDICETPTFWLDLDGSVVNGDCYWLTLNPGIDEDLLWLSLAVANSSFIEAFYDHSFNNKLYSGRRRFITQYVETFPLPDPVRAESKRMIDLAKQIYQLVPSPSTENLESRLNALVWQVFGVAQSKKSAGSGI